MTSNSIVLFGVKSTTRVILNHLIDSGVNVDLVVGLDESAISQYHISGFSNLRKECKDNDIDYFPAKDYSLKDSFSRSYFENKKFNLGISYGWQRLIPQYVLSRFQKGVFGFHGSSYKLPKGKGRSPLNWSLIENKKYIYNNFFKYDSGIDSGPIFSTTKFEINEFDNILSLQIKSLLSAKIEILKIVESCSNNNLILNKQSGESTFYPKRTPDDGKIDLEKDMDEIYNLIRGITKPFPGAFLFCNNKKITIWSAFPFDNELDFSSYNVGEVIDVITGNPIVKLINGTIIIYDYESSIDLKKGDILE